MNRVYVGSELSIGRMYDLYRDKCAAENCSAMSSDYYRRIFCEEYNIGFAAPKSDTCKTCDKFENDLKSAEPQGVEKLRSEYNQHKGYASKAYDLLRSDSELEKSDPSSQHVIAFDLQKALPTPKLSCGPAFYKRKLWTYNVAVHNCASGGAKMMMWPETVAGRGADEIASCILKYFDGLVMTTKTLIAYSDNCGGQNKNGTIVGLWMRLISEEKFDEIIHRFPISGHTMLPCDRDFADIERVVRKIQHVYTPEVYMDIVRKARRHNQFEVHEMTANDITDRS